MKTIKDFWSIVNLQMVLVCAMAVGATYVCHHFEFEAKLPTGLISLAVIFPIVFSINAAYKRREDALKSFSGLKAHAVSLYYSHRDWVPGEEGVESEHCERIRGIIQALIAEVKEDLLNSARHEAGLHKVLAEFSRLSQSHEALREAKVTGSEISRANQYVSKMMIDYEKMRAIAAYRTPVSLRSYSRIFLHVFPIAFGPFFAHLMTESYIAVGYSVAVTYGVVLVALDNIQEDLEDPFDQIGSDDIRLDVYKEYRPVFES